MDNSEELGISKEERGWIGIMRFNKMMEGKDEITKTWHLGRLKICFRWRSSKCLMGRFGGGWNWALGFAASSSTLLLNCLIFAISFSITNKKLDGSNAKI
mgnify:CR=1 FL=1